MSRFTTWVYKFALLEAAVKLRKRPWQEREVPLEPETWNLFASAGLDAGRGAVGGSTMTKRPDLVARQLGSSEPEVGCDECFDELDRYVELELAGADAAAAVPGLRAQLDGCPACREEYESLRGELGDS